MYVLNTKANKHYSQYNCKTLDRSQVILFKLWNLSLTLNVRNIPGACLCLHLSIYYSVCFVYFFLSLSLFSLFFFFSTKPQLPIWAFFPSNLSLLELGLDCPVLLLEILEASLCNIFAIWCYFLRWTFPSIFCRLNKSMSLGLAAVFLLWWNPPKGLQTKLWMEI